MKEGLGKLKMKNGYTYQGEFKKDKMNGQGTMYFNKEKTSFYEGDFLDNTMTG